MFVLPRSGSAPKPRVLKGNWYEEHLAIELKLSEFADKRQETIESIKKGAKASALKWTSMSEHIQLVERPYKSLSHSAWTQSGPIKNKKTIKFGDLVQIKSEKGHTLAFDLWTTTFVPCTQGSKPGKMEYLLLASTFKGVDQPKALSRNVFEIAKCPGEEYEDDVLRNGIKFRLLIPKGRFDDQFAIKSVPVSIAKMANLDRTEVVLSKEIDGFDAAWQIRDRERKLKSWETPAVQSNTPLLLNHCSSNAFMMCRDDALKKYILDDASQVLSSTDVDFRKYDCYQWRIVPLEVKNE